MSDHIIIGERHRQRRLSGDSAGREYVIRGTEDALEARAAMLTEAPVTVLTNEGKELPRKLSQCQVTELAQGIYEGRMSWGSSGSSQTTDPGNARSSFELGGLSVSRMTSISTVNSYAPTGETAPDFRRFMDIQEDGSPRPVQLPAQGYLVYNEGWDFDVADVTNAYIRGLADLLLCVSSSTFRGFEVGEICFLGASGRLRPEGDLVQIDFRFGISHNYSGISVDNISGITKRGWDYLWTYFEPEEDDEATPKYIIRKPKAVYIEQVHEYKSFAGLGIGS